MNSFPGLSDALNDLKSIGPSWKTDVQITYTERGDWTLQVCDIWGHIHSPEFTGSDLGEIIDYAGVYITKFVQTMDMLGPMPYMDDDGEMQCINRKMYPMASNGIIDVEGNADPGLSELRERTMSDYEAKLTDEQIKDALDRRAEQLKPLTPRTFLAWLDQHPEAMDLPMVTDSVEAIDEHHLCDPTVFYGRVALLMVKEKSND